MDVIFGRLGVGVAADVDHAAERAEVQDLISAKPSAASTIRSPDLTIN
jgi:hypothetical protein